MSAFRARLHMDKLGKTGSISLGPASRFGAAHAEHATASPGAEFKGFGQKEGLVAWRIENKVPVPVAADQLGVLYKGDSYLYLKTVKPSGGGALQWNLHYWLGSESSADEQGIAAYKAIELDDALGGGPVQYRECEGHESNLFTSYFKKTGLRYKAGGVASGFAHVDRSLGAAAHRLLMCKGKRTVRSVEVPVKASSLTTGDVFLLDLGDTIFVYNGSNANRAEKQKGFELAEHIRSDERGARATIVRIDEDPDNAAFWAALGGKIEVTNPGEDDEAAEKKGQPKLLRVSTDSGELVVSVETPRDAKGRLTRDALDTNDVFLVDCPSEIFVWVGHGTDAIEKKTAMMVANEYLKASGKPKTTPVTRVAEGAESTTFKGQFVEWEKPKPLTFTRPGEQSGAGVAKAKESHIDVGGLVRRSGSSISRDLGTKRQADAPLDDGSGKLQVWRVEKMAKAPWPESKYGRFFDGDSYVLLYTYRGKGGREEYMIYFWQGHGSSKDEVGASALLANQLDDELGGRPVQCRVVQGKEPGHMRALFKGRMIVHAGGIASGFKNRHDTDTIDNDGIALFHIKGTSALDTMAVQVAERAASLNSGDCFVLLMPKAVFLWQGKGANEAEVATATNIAELLKDVDSTGEPLAKPRMSGIIALTEGEEPGMFWKALGGKGEYPKMRPGEPAPCDPRLFQLSNSTGALDVDEIFDFSQDDLIDEDVMLLDTHSTVFVWVGSGANEQEQRYAMTFAKDYIAQCADVDGRDVDTPAVRVSAGAEPALFTQWFLGWDPELSKKNTFNDPYEARLAKQRDDAAKKSAAAVPAYGSALKKGGGLANLLADDAAVAPPPPEAPSVPAAWAAPPPAPASVAPGETLSLAVLQLAADKLPAGVDASQRQNYLSDAEFQSVFGMDKAAFEKLPGWKKTAAKKKADLF